MRTTEMINKALEVTVIKKQGDMRTTEMINKALEVMNGQDWYWYLSDYQVAEMRDKAYSTMRYFVELVASISDAKIRKAMRELYGIKFSYEFSN